jgi:Holliday junction DNA helicase RuvA
LIDRLRGVVIDKGVDYLVLEVGGIGFRVQVPSFVWEQIIIGEEVALHTYLHVRDDAWTLYGFLTKEDLSLFMELIGVSGVGPRLGVKILSGTSPGQFRQAVVNGDVGALTLIPGIGKKTAQRIVLELGERLKKMGGAEDLAVPADSPVADALAALMALGYSRGEASAALQQAVAEQGQDGAEEIVRRALRHLL